MNLPFIKPKVFLKPMDLSLSSIVKDESYSSSSGKDAFFLTKRIDEYMCAFPAFPHPAYLDLIEWYYDRAIGAETKVCLLNQELKDLKNRRERNDISDNIQEEIFLIAPSRTSI